MDGKSKKKNHAESKRKEQSKSKSAGAVEDQKEDKPRTQTSESSEENGTKPKGKGQSKSKSAGAVEPQKKDKSQKHTSKSSEGNGTKPKGKEQSKSKSAGAVEPQKKDKSPTQTSKSSEENGTKPKEKGQSKSKRAGAVEKQKEDKPQKHTTEALTIVGVNVNSLKKKMEKTRKLVADNNVDILVIGESKLDNTILDRDVDIPGFRIVRVDRDSNGGGVAVYICNDIKTTGDPIKYRGAIGFDPIKYSCQDKKPIKLKPEDKVELVVVHVTDPINFSLLAIYKSPSAPWDDFNAMVGRVFDLDYPTLLVGDINIDTQKEWRRAEALKTCLNKKAKLLIDEPTRYKKEKKEKNGKAEDAEKKEKTEKTQRNEKHEEKKKEEKKETGSCIDHFIAKNLETKDCPTLALFSDHKPILCKIKQRPQNLECRASCGKSFSDEWRRTYHEIKKHYPCVACSGRVYKYKKDLKKHIEEHGCIDKKISRIYQRVDRELASHS